jgi:hypothetical protein
MIVALKQLLKAEAAARVGGKSRRGGRSTTERPHSRLGTKLWKEFAEQGGRFYKAELGKRPQTPAPYRRAPFPLKPEIVRNEVCRVFR